MIQRFPGSLVLAVAMAAAAMMVLSACKLERNAQELPTPTPTPIPIPTPTPPIYVPAKHMEVAKLFSGIQVHTSFETQTGTNAETERNDPSSYTLNLELKVKVPTPHADIDDLKALNANLPDLLPWLAAGLQKARVSPFYDDLYRFKVNAINRDLPHLDQLVSRQHFFDCETAIELQSGTSKRRALLVQAAMEVDTDGSDSDRVPIVDGSSSTFQPMTSYKWAKKTPRVNPFLAPSEDRYRKYELELASHPSPDRAHDLNETLIPDIRDQINDLKKYSFLVAADDPYIVVPGLLRSKDYGAYAPKIGDYCVVIFNKTLYPAIIGDVGPNYKIGEASLRLCKEINVLANANNRPVSDLKVTYLIFPNTADEPFAAPDLDKWYARCDQLLNEMGGYQGELKAWEDLTKPKPTPTPTPSASPGASVPSGTTASPSATASGSSSATPSVQASSSPSVTPGASQAPSVTTGTSH